MRGLITGGCGYIGSHTVCELLKEGMDIVIIDNFSNSKHDVMDKIEKLTTKKPILYEGDVCDKKILEKIFQKEKIDFIIHFAGYKAVGESVKEPLKYYQNNLESTMSLLEVSKKYGCKNFIFSSSATVYGNPKTLPIKEEFPLSTTNPYGTTKLMIERILTDFYKANPGWNITILRYFNPIGNEESGLLGEEPQGTPNNLMPYIVRVAVRVLPYLSIFGDSYDTKDGTGVRDYIHVVDLAKGHVCATLKKYNHPGIYIYNLGTGTCYSVLEIVKTFEKVNNVKIPYKITEKRAGDIAVCYADVTKAKKELGFIATKTLEDMCRDAYTYIIKNSSYDKKTLNFK